MVGMERALFVLLAVFVHGNNGQVGRNYGGARVALYNRSAQMQPQAPIPTVNNSSSVTNTLDADARNTGNGLLGSELNASNSNDEFQVIGDSRDKNQYGGINTSQNINVSTQGLAISNSSEQKPDEISAQPVTSKPALEFPDPANFTILTINIDHKAIEKRFLDYQPIELPKIIYYLADRGKFPYNKKIENLKAVYYQDASAVFCNPEKAKEFSKGNAGKILMVDSASPCFSTKERRSQTKDKIIYPNPLQASTVDRDNMIFVIIRLAEEFQSDIVAASISLEEQYDRYLSYTTPFNIGFILMDTASFDLLSTQVLKFSPLDLPAITFSLDLRLVSPLPI